MRRRTLPAMVVIAALVVFAAVGWYEREIGAAAGRGALPPPVDPIGALGLQERTVPSSGAYAMIYVAEESPFGLAGSPITDVLEIPYWFNTETQSLYIREVREIPLKSDVIILQDSFLGTVLFDSQLAVAEGGRASVQVRPLSLQGLVIDGPDADKVMEMVQNQFRLLGEVRATLQPDNRVQVSFNGEQRVLSAGEEWRIEKSLTADGISAPSTLVVRYYGLWPLQNVTRLNQ